MWLNYLPFAYIRNMCKGGALKPHQMYPNPEPGAGEIWGMWGP